MRYFLSIAFIAFAVSACSKPTEFGEMNRSRYAVASAPASPSAALGRTSDKQVDRDLAYRHQLNLEVEDAKVGVAFEAGQAACLQASSDACLVLDSSIESSDRYARASIKFRAASGGIAKLIDAMSHQGAIKSRSTSAEDLSGAIADTAKRLEMQTQYRTRLEALMARPNLDADALIRLNKELAEVQADIEAETAQRATLKQRVDTEILEVEITPRHAQTTVNPISEALSGFGGNLSQGIATTITVVAVMLPWIILLAVVVWVVRSLWRRRRRARATL